MSNNLIQTELDMVEEYIITCLFGNVQQPKVNDLVKSFITLSGKNVISVINDTILKFENTVRPLLKENGYVDGEKFSNLLSIKFNQKIPIYDFRLIDGARAMEPILIMLRNFIQ